MIEGREPRVGDGSTVTIVCRKGKGAPEGPSRCVLSRARRWSAASCSPTGWTGSTIGARGLNFRVRHGTGCSPPAMAADRRRARGGRVSPAPSGPHSIAKRTSRTCQVRESGKSSAY